MGAIYKRELKASLNGLYGAVAVSVMLLVAGLMFRFYNLYNGALTLHYAVSNSTLIFYIVIPILSMRVFAEEKRQRTDQLLLTSPVGLPGIVFGKYLAQVTVFAVPVGVMCLYPLVMTGFGQETVRWDYGCILMFFLMGCAYLSVGMFISSATENSVIAAILCLLFVFVTQMIGSVFTIIVSSGFSALIFLVALAALAGLLAWFMTGNFYLSFGIFAGLALLFIILFQVKPGWFSGRTESVLRVLDYYTHFQDIAAGSLGISNAAFFLAWTAAGIALTFSMIGRRGVHGTYSLAMTAGAIAASVIACMIVSSLPADRGTLDLTDQKLFSIGDETRELLGSLEQDVTLYYITESGEEDEGVEKLLDVYEAASPRVSVERVDAVRSPAFTKQYTDENVSLNSVIAVSGGKAAVADYSLFYRYASGEVTYTAYAYDAEGRITSAILAACDDTVTKVYCTTGHGELALGAEFTDAMEKAHIESLSINLLSETIPADCAALIIFAPGQDLTAAEANKVLKYLYAGGRALMVSMPRLLSGADTPNYDSVLSAYGITRADGLVMEGDVSRFVQAPYLVIPGVSDVSDVTAGAAGTNIVCALAEALNVEEDEDAAYSVTPLLYTSDSAYLKTDIDTTVEKEAGDPAGHFVLAVAAEQTFSRDTFGKSDIPEDNADEEEEEEEDPGVTKLFCFTTPCLFSADALSLLIQQSTALPEGNSSLLTGVLKSLTGRETAVSVAPRLLTTPQTTISAGAVNALGILFMLALPAAVLAAGIAVWAVRRRR